MERVAVIGATGSIGRVVMAVLSERGMTPLAVVRDRDRAAKVLPGADAVVADLRDQVALSEALGDVDAVVLVHGADADPEGVDYGAVPAVLAALDGARPRIVLMTSIAVTHATGSWREVMHWKARGERLVRASGVPFTIVRPGWFDEEPAGHGDVVLEQGDRTLVDSRRGVARRHIAEAIAQALSHAEAEGVTFELFSAPGQTTGDWRARFAELAKDVAGSLDAVLNSPGPEVDEEPQRFQDDLARWRGAFLNQ